MPFWPPWAFAVLSQRPPANAQEGDGVREAAQLRAKGEVGGKRVKAGTTVSAAEGFLQLQKGETPPRRIAGMKGKRREK